jgi:hypothetical protein
LTIVMADQQSAPSTRNIAEFVDRLLAALRRSGQSQASLATTMYYSKSMLTKVVKGDHTPDERFLRIFFERGIPFLIAFGGLSEANEVRAMAAAAGVRVSEAELRVAAQGARDPDVVVDARRRGSSEADEVTAADLRLARDYARARADMFEQTIAPPEPAPTVTAPAPEADARRWLETVGILAVRHCSLTPAVLGRRLHAMDVLDRPVLFGSKTRPVAFSRVLKLLEGRSALLAGVPGSGRSSLLRMLGYQLMCQWEAGRPQAIYMRAPEVLKRAGRRRTVIELAAEQLIAVGAAEASEIKTVVQALDELDRDRRLLWLVDDVDRLSEAGLIDLAGHFVVSQAIFAVSPVQLESAQHHLNASGKPVALSLPDLTPHEQHDLLQRFHRVWSEAMPDADARQTVLDQVPALARLPIGLAAVFVHMETDQQISPVQITETAIREYFDRAGLEFALEWDYWPGLLPAARALSVLAMATLEDLVWHSLAPEVYRTTRARFEESAGKQYRTDWDALAATRLCLVDERGDQPVAQFFNDDLLCYWSSRRDSLYTHPDPDALPERTRDLAGRANAFIADRRAQAPPAP